MKAVHTRETALMATIGVDDAKVAASAYEGDL
jgi:hypothetical protein